MLYINEINEVFVDCDEYAVFGSGPMAIRNIRKNRDLDIIVTFEKWKQMRKTHDKYLCPTKSCIRIKHMTITPTWPGLKRKDVDEIILEAEIIQNIRFAGLRHVVEYKKILKRPKDIIDIRLINQSAK